MTQDTRLSFDHLPEIAAAADQLAAIDTTIVPLLLLSSGRQVPATLLLCPRCGRLNSNTTVDTSRWPELTISHGNGVRDHTWRATVDG